MQDNSKFCPSCGKVSEQAPAAEVRAPVQPVQYTNIPQQWPQPLPNRAHGTKKGLIITVALGGAVLLGLCIFLIYSAINGGGTSRKVSAKGLPDITYSYLTQEKQVDVDYVATQKIYPNLYSTMDSIINFTATCEGGESNVLVKAEVVGFTQPYEQKVTLNEQITNLYVKPAVLTGNLDLKISKDAQLKFSVTDIDSGEVLIQDTKIIKLMSIYDFILWEDEFGDFNLDNALAWLTPESDGILTLRRTAIDWMSDYTDRKFNSLAGYQLSSIWGNDKYYLNTVMQIVGIQAAMSDLGIRYNMGSFSMTEGYNQRVLLPDDVIYNGSGVCIETALVMASAIQSANMHAMLIFPPGHAQVAVESWRDSGEYYLVETTLLPFYGSDSEIDELVVFYDADEWVDYLADPWGDGSGSCYVVDCDMATSLGIVGLSN